MSRPPRVVSAGPRLAAKAKARRRDRRAVLLRRAGWGLGAVLPLLLLGWVVLASSLLAVQKVVVTGETRLTAAQVVQAAQVADGTPLAKVDTGAVARRIRALGPVAEVSVTRGWPHSLRVKVVERVPVVAVPVGGSVRLVDDDAVAIGTVARIPKGVFRLDLAGATDEMATTRAALGVLRTLPKGLRAQVFSVRASSPEQVSLLMRGGRQVLWGGDEDGPAKAAAVIALLKLPGTVFDVSAPGVVTRR